MEVERQMKAEAEEEEEEEEVQGIPRRLTRSISLSGRCIWGVRRSVRGRVQVLVAVKARQVLGAEGDAWLVLGKIKDW